MKLHYLLVSLLTFLGSLASAQVAEVNSSGRTSYFWLTLKPQAGTVTGADTDLVLANGYRSVDLSSPNLSCTRVQDGLNWVYQITWTGNNLMGDDEAETLTFNVVVEAYSGADYTYIENASTVNSFGTGAIVSDLDNRWSVGDDININAGESIKMSQDEFAVNGVNVFAKELLLESNFTGLTLVETLGSFNHKVIFGTGENLSTANFKQPTENFDLSGTSFSLTGAGSQVEGKHFAVEQVSFSFVIRNLALTQEDPNYTFSDLHNGHNYDSNAVELMSHLPELEKGVRPWDWDSPKRWAEIRKNTGPFTEEEMEIITNAADLAGDVSFTEFHPDILYTAGYMNLEKDTRGAGLTGHYQEAPEHYLYNPDGTVLYGGVENAYFNLANPDLREWWLSEAERQIAGNEYEGCSFFVDALAKVGVVASGDFYDYWGNPVSGDSYWEEAKKLMDELRERYADKVFLAGNFARPGTGDNRTAFTMNYSHISYIESFEHFGNYIPHANEGIAMMQDLSRAGKWIQITVNDAKPIPSDSLSLDEMRAKAQAAMPAIWAEYTETERDELAGLYAYFPVKLAMFLMGAGERSYFKYTGSKVVRTAGRDLFKNIMPFPEWDMALGAPLENGVNNDNVWWRRFEHVDVVYDLTQGTSRFIHKQTPNKENIALLGTATQSSSASKGSPENAIDGNINGAYTYSSVALTNEETNPWWEVDFGADYTINEINVLGRIDQGYPNGLFNYILSIINSNGDTTFSQVFGKYPSEIVDAGGVEGQKVHIQLTGVGALALAEVEVFSNGLVTANNMPVTISEEAISVFPNPTTGVIQFSEVTEYFIMNSLGQTVLSGEGKTIDLSAYPNGLYSILIEGSSQQIIKK